MPSQTKGRSETKGRAEKKLDQQKEKRWAEGSSKAKAKHGMTLNQLVKARGEYAKGSRERKAIQNSINEALGSKKRHAVAKAPSSKSIKQKAVADKFPKTDFSKIDKYRPASKKALAGLKKKKAIKSLVGR